MNSIFLGFLEIFVGIFGELLNNVFFGFWEGIWIRVLVRNGDN